MPKITLTFSDEAAIPAELKAFKKADSNTVEIWAGDKVAEETNPALASNRDAILAEKQTAVAAKETLERTVADLSKTTTDLRTQIAASAGQPNVTADDIALLEVVKPLNLKPDDLKKQIQTGTQAAAEMVKLKSQLHTSNVAKALNWNEDVLADLLKNEEKSKGVEFVFEDVTKDGKTTKEVMVAVKDDKGAVSKHAVDDFVKSQASWTPYMPILAQKGKTPGVAWPRQTPAGGQRTSGKDEADILGSHIAERNKVAAAQPNPLRPNAVTPPVQTAGS